MTDIPQSNVTMIALTAPGGSADYGVASTQGADRWVGQLDAYLIDDVKTTYSGTGGTVGKLRDSRLYIASDALSPHPSELDSGDTVTFIKQDGSTHTRKIMEINEPESPNPAINTFITMHLDPSPYEA